MKCGSCRATQALGSWLGESLQAGSGGGGWMYGVWFGLGEAVHGCSLWLVGASPVDASLSWKRRYIIYLMQAFL